MNQKFCNKISKQNISWSHCILYKWRRYIEHQVVPFGFNFQNINYLTIKPFDKFFENQATISKNKNPILFLFVLTNFKKRKRKLLKINEK